MPIEQLIKLINHLDKFIKIMEFDNDELIKAILERLTILFKQQFQTNAFKVEQTLNSLPKSVVDFVTKDFINCSGIEFCKFDNPLEILAHNDRQFIIKSGANIKLFDTHLIQTGDIDIINISSNVRACFSPDNRSFAVSSNYRISIYEFTDDGFRYDRIIDLNRIILSMVWIGDDITFISNKCFGLVNVKTIKKVIYNQFVYQKPLSVSFTIDDITYYTENNKLMLKSSRLDCNLFNSLYNNIDNSELSYQFGNCSMLIKIPALVKQELFKILDQAKDEIEQNNKFFESINF